MWNHLSRSTMWCILTAFFGLLQVWLVLIIHYLILVDKPLPPGKLFIDGALLFFSTAVVSSLAIDYHYLPQKEVLPWASHFKKMMFFAFPFAIVFVSTALFIICYLLDILAPETKIHSQIIWGLELIVITTTLVYAFFVKLITFKIECGENRQ